MRLAGRHRRIGTRGLMTLMTVLLLSLTSLPDAAQESPSPDEEAKFRSEWQTVRQNYERAIRAHQEQIGAIEAKERRFSVDPQKRAEKITKDALAGTKASLKGDGKVQAASLDRVGAEWGSRGEERKKLQEASAALPKNIDLIRSHLAVVAEAARAMSTRVQQSGVLEKAMQGEAAAKDAGDRLSARWELERAARERAREQREREAGERTRGGRIP